MTADARRHSHAVAPPAPAGRRRRDPIGVRGVGRAVARRARASAVADRRGESPTPTAWRARLVRLVRLRARRTPRRRADLAGRDARCGLPLRRPRDRVRPRRAFGAARLDRGRVGERRGRRRGRRSSRRPSSARTRHPCRRSAPVAHPAADAPAVRWRHDPRRYAELIAECQAAIVRGDAYQLCLTNRVDVDVQPDPAVDLPRACAPRARATTAASCGSATSPC